MLVALRHHDRVARVALALDELAEQPQVGLGQRVHERERAQEGELRAELALVHAPQSGRVVGLLERRELRGAQALHGRRARLVGRERAVAERLARRDRARAEAHAEVLHRHLHLAAQHDVEAIALVALPEITCSWPR